MSQEDYINQLEDENAALKKKLEEKPIEEYPHNKILNLRSLNEITEDNPLVITDKNNKPKYKLVLAYRNKRNGYVIMKIKIRSGWFGWKYKDMQGCFDDWVAYPVSLGNTSSDKVNDLITDDNILMGQAFFRMLESIGIIDRNDKKIGM
jgi:hypothetical protein